MENNDKMIVFALQATINVLPTKDNLRRWGASVVDASCPLCGWHSATLRHVLNGCPRALEQGRYTYRHDKILRCIQHAIAQHLQQKPCQPPEPNDYIQFVKAGNSVPPKPRRQIGLLAQMDW